MLFEISGQGKPVCGGETWVERNEGVSCESRQKKCQSTFAICISVVARVY